VKNTGIEISFPVLWNISTALLNLFLSDIILYFLHRSRFVNGIGYVKQKITLLTGNMEKDSDHFVLIAHSMGTAYAEGIAEGLRRNGWNVDYLLSLNAFQFGLVKPYCTPTKIIDYRNTDDLLSPDCNVMGAYLQIREKSVPYKGNAHIYPVWGAGKNFWSKLPPRDTLTEIRLA